MGNCDSAIRRRSRACSPARAGPWSAPRRNGWCRCAAKWSKPARSPVPARASPATTMPDAQDAFDRFCVRIADKRPRPPARLAAIMGDEDAAAFLARGLGTAVITLGAQGAFVKKARLKAHVPAVNAGNPVETTGAGDLGRTTLAGAGAPPAGGPPPLHPAHPIPPPRRPGRAPADRPPAPGPPRRRGGATRTGAGRWTPGRDFPTAARGRRPPGSASRCPAVRQARSGASASTTATTRRRPTRRSPTSRWSS